MNLFLTNREGLLNLMSKYSLRAIIINYILNLGGTI